VNRLIPKALLNLSPGSEFSVDQSDNIKWHVVVGTKPTDEEIDAEVNRLSSNLPWDDLRFKRDNLLSKTDWTANSDVVMTDEMKTYRQALRDLPANTADPVNPTWPEL